MQETNSTSQAGERTQEDINKSLSDRAWKVVIGEAKGSEDAIEIKGAQNDYNSRGNGTTMARRVLRNGSWEWVSAPASRHRYLAADRKDITRGSVYEGEIVAQYTLGRNSKPDAVYFVTCREMPLVPFAEVIKTKDGFRLIRKNGESITVTSPYWK